MPEIIPRPLVSVVIPSVNGLPVLAECVESFLALGHAGLVEVVVADRCGPETRSELAGRFPEVRLLAAPPRTSIPALRALAIREARGTFVAVTEDHCLAQEGWLGAVDRACLAGCPTVGGPVENGSPGRLVDWAAFFCEYAPWMGPLPAGAVPETPGNNTAYDRRLLERLRPELEGEVWEAFLHARIRELGVGFHCDPAMVVLHKKTFGYGYFVSQRYHYSRSFAGMRLRGARWWRRMAYACGTALLPAVLLVRISRIVARKRRHLKEYLLSLPILMTFLIVWAFGEWVGALLGPGRSLEYVE